MKFQVGTKFIFNSIIGIEEVIIINEFQVVTQDSNGIFNIYSFRYDHNNEIAELYDMVGSQMKSLLDIVFL